MNIDDLINRLQAKRSGDNSWRAKCPSHDDRNPSLSISEARDGRILLHCHAGCSAEKIVAALGLTSADLFVQNRSRITAFRTLDDAIAFMERRLDMRATRRDVYHNRNRGEHFLVVRFDGATGKQFRPFSRDSSGDWIAKDPRGKLPLFGLSELIARPSENVFVVEGEKCACELATIGLLTTTSAHGAKAADKTDWQPLAGREIVILPDNDPEGRRYAETVSGILNRLSPPAVVRIVELSGLPPKGDCVDWLDARDAQEPENIAAELLGLVNNTEAIPPPAKNSNDIRGEIVSILTDPKLVGSARHDAVATVVLDALIARGRFFYHAERRDFDSAMFFDGERKRLERIRSDAFTAWLSEWTAINMADTSFRFVTAAIETTAVAGPVTTGILPETFWASRPGTFYLSNGDGAMVRITAGNVELVDNGTDDVLFAVGSTLKPWKLTGPRDPFETCAVFRHASYAAQHGRDLSRLWLFSLPTNPRCKPSLCEIGDVGSGKTKLAKGCTEFYGLPFVANKADDTGEDSFWVSADAGGIFVLDNCDTRNRWLADCVASHATDGCSDRRKLYTDSQRIVLRARAWLILTSANPVFGADSGLADRLIVVRMNRRTDETSDEKLSAEILEHRNAGLSYLAQTLSRALADKKSVPVGLNHRHPDFAAFAVRIGRAIGREQETVAALQSAETDKSFFCLENDTASAAVMGYLHTVDGFEGTAAELLEALKEFDPDLAASTKNGKPLWSAKRLGKHLLARWPHLEKVMEVAKQEKDRKGFTIYTFKAKSAECAEFESTIPIKSTTHAREREKSETSNDNRQTRQDPLIAEAIELFNGKVV